MFKKTPEFDFDLSISADLEQEVVKNANLWFQRAVIYYILSPFDNAVSDKLHKIGVFNSEELHLNKDVHDL